MATRTNRQIGKRTEIKTRSLPAREALSRSYHRRHRFTYTSVQIRGDSLEMASDYKTIEAELGERVYFPNTRSPIGLILLARHLAVNISVLFMNCFSSCPE